MFKVVPVSRRGRSISRWGSIYHNTVRRFSFSATANLLFHAQSPEKTIEYGTQAANHTMVRANMHHCISGGGWQVGEFPSWALGELGSWGVGELGSWRVGEWSTDRHAKQKSPSADLDKYKLSSRQSVYRRSKYQTFNPSLSQLYDHTHTKAQHHHCPSSKVEAKLLSTTRYHTTVPRT